MRTASVATLAQVNRFDYKPQPDRTGRPVVVDAIAETTDPVTAR